MTENDFPQNYDLTGEKFEIIPIPSAVLSKNAEPVTEFDDELKTLCKNMLYTMYNAPGIGLAAPQIGVSKRLFVLDVDFSREEVTRADGTVEYELLDLNPQIIINPVITELEGSVTHEEGCLSIPGVYEEVTRPATLTVEYQDINGAKLSLKADELLSRCIQHETDHLNGKLFIDNISLLKRNLIKKKFAKKKKFK
jgi:peptide deformylase